MTTISTPEGLSAFGWLQIIHGLSLEINTTMKLSRRGSLLAVCARKGYTGPTRGTAKNKGLALRWAIEQIQAIDPEYTAKGVVARALEATS